jgi:hypothetical protein
MNSRRQALALAGALTTTVLTTAIALAGFSHHPTGSKAPTPVVRIVAPAPAPAAHWADD